MCVKILARQGSSEDVRRNANSMIAKLLSHPVPFFGMVAACLAAVAAVPATAEPVRLPAFGEVVDVKVINLEVVVTRRGQRVGGLGAEDFRLLVAGEETPIEFFTEISQGRAAAAAPSVAGVAPAVSPGEVVGTRYLVFIDDDFAVPSARNRVLRQLAAQAALLQPEDRMAVVAFDGRRLDLLTSWTRSLAHLETVFTQAQERRAHGLVRRSQQRRLSTQSQARAQERYDSRPPGGTSFSATGFFGLGRALEDSEAPEVLHYGDADGQVARVVRAATSAMRGFARPPGRKVMLLLAGDWQTYRESRDRDGFERLKAERRLFSPLVDTANRLGYTLYPVDVRADRGVVSINAESGRLAVGRYRDAFAREGEKLGEDALYHLAQQTGGRAFVAGARVTALKGAIDDTRSYYWLGFTPTWQEDDQAYEVEIEMRPKALKARARASFSDLSRQTEVSMWVESAHLFDAPLAGSGGLKVELGEIHPAGVGKIVVPLHLEIPFDQVTLLPHEGGFAAHLELRVAATDADGARADLPIIPVDLVRPGAAGGGQIGIYETRLKLRRKPHRLLIALYDPLSETFLAQRLDFAP